LTTRYDAGSRIFHWLVALALLVQLPAGIAMLAPGFAQGTTDRLYVLHKGLGIVVLVIVLSRILWRLTHPTPPMSAATPPLERRIAGVTHGLIYALLVTIALSGYIRVVADGYPIELLDRMGIPPLLPLMPTFAAAMSLLHRFAAFLLVALVAIHIAEVLRHHLVLRDGTLGRMWPPFGGATGPGPTAPALSRREAGVVVQHDHAKADPRTDPAPRDGTSRESFPDGGDGV